MLQQIQRINDPALATQAFSYVSEAIHLEFRENFI